MEFKNYLGLLAEKSAVVHCITNTVTVNDCANAVLAIGAGPVMAEHPAETAQITSAADALLINMGSLTDSKIAAMKSSAEAAKNSGIPFTLDCVGIASSDIRLKTVEELIKINMPSIIKGNAAEIAALCNGVMAKHGVDSVGAADEAAARAFAVEHKTVVAVTGETDIITNGVITARVRNGCALMTRVTGTGCMLGCVAAAFSSVADAFEAAVYAAAVMGICGERAFASGAAGTGSFRVGLMDNLSLITDADVAKYAKID